MKLHVQFVPFVNKDIGAETTPISFDGCFLCRWQGPLDFLGISTKGNDIYECPKCRALNAPNTRVVKSIIY